MSTRKKRLLDAVSRSGKRGACRSRIVLGCGALIRLLMFVALVGPAVAALAQAAPGAIRDTGYQASWPAQAPAAFVSEGEVASGEAWSSPAGASQLEALRGRGDSPEVPSASEPVGQAPSPAARQQPNTAPVNEQTGILTPRGHFVLEPSVEYQYTSNSQVALIGFTIIPAITVGLIDIRQVKQSTVVGALTGRYGITNWLEFDVKVPYVYRDQQSITRPLATSSTTNEVFSATGHDIGDVEVALRYQFNQGGASTPYFIGSLRAILPTGKNPFEVSYAQTSSASADTLQQQELPTGAGFYGIEPGITAIFPSDPAVFFGGVNYLYNFARAVDKTIGGSYIGEVQPGDQISFNFGMGLALNARSSVSLGYQHTFIEKTEYNGAFPSDATTLQLGQLLIGYSYSFTPATSLNVSLGAGLTQDTPDVSLTVRVPIMF